MQDSETLNAGPFGPALLFWSTGNSLPFSPFAASGKGETGESGNELPHSQSYFFMAAMRILLVLGRMMRSSMSSPACSFSRMIFPAIEIGFSLG